VIEVESSLKNKRRYARIFTDLYVQYGREDAILYIVKDETEMKWLMKYARDWDRIYFTTLEKVQKIDYGLLFTNAKGETLYLPRLHKGGVLFFDPDEETDREFRESEAEFERFRKEEVSNNQLRKENR